MELWTEPVEKSHKRKSFDCGKESLDRYITEQARQDADRKLAACFVLVNEGKEVKGYYTLSGSHIPQKDLPQKITKQLKIAGAYTKIPVTLLGRLAIDRSLMGMGYGAFLLIDALRRSYRSSEEVGSLAVIADPLDEEAKSFYDKFGFISLPDSGKMFLPMRTIEKLIEEQGL